jgi:phospholipid/cholesterol/gamma-HCH transport system substrate-binding protein
MKRRDEVLVGVFTTVAVLLLIAGTLWLARRGLSRSYPMYTRQAWGAGLKKGQQVLLAGVQVGYVDDIALRMDGFLDVSMSIQDEYKIPEGTRAGIEQVSFFGDKAVRLDPPLGAHGFVREGDTLPAAPAAVSLDQILARVDTSTQTLNDVAQAVDIQLVQKGGLADLRETIRSTNALMQQLNGIAQEQSRNLTLTMTSLRRTTSAIDSASVDSTMRNIRTTSANLSLLTTSMHSATAHLDSIITRLDAGQGTAGKLLRDDALYVDLRSAVMRMDSLLADIKKNPKRYINVKVF